MGWLLPLDGSTYLFACTAVVVAALAQGTTGWGFGMVAAPLMAIVDPSLVPGPLLFLAMLVSILVTIREWRSVDRTGLLYGLAGRIPASFVAGFTVAAIPAALFGVLFGALVLVAVALSVAGWQLMPTRRNLVMAGLASGYMGTITSIGAPPMALVYQHNAAAEARSTMGAFFVVGALWSLIALASFGAFGVNDMLISLNLVPALVVGFILSNLIVMRIDKRRMRQIVLTFCTASAVVLLATSMM